MSADVTSRRIAVSARLAGMLLLALALATGMPAHAGRYAYSVEGPVLSIVDDANPSVVARVALGSPATGAVAADATGKYVYVATRDNLAVVDTASRTIVATVPLGGARALLLQPGGPYLYASGNISLPSTPSAQRFAAVDTRTRVISTAFPVTGFGGVLGMAARPDGTRLYLAHDGGLLVIDTATNTTAGRIALAARGSIAADPTGRYVYAAVWGGVAVVDTASDTLVTTISEDATTAELVVQTIAFDPTGTLAYVSGTEIGAAGPQGKLLFIDTRTRAITASMALNAALAIAVHPAGNRLYLLNGGNCLVPDECLSGRIAVVDVPSRSRVGEILAFTGTDLLGPAAIALQSSGSALYVFKSAGLAVIDTASGSISARLPGSAGLVVAPDLPPVAGAQYQYTLSSATGAPGWVAWGVPGDRAVPADYDGDGRADIAVWRPREASGEGFWYIRRSSDGESIRRQWGAAYPGDVPVPADYDGDGRADLAVWRPAEGGWYIVRSSDDAVVYSSLGASTDRPVPADYDGDGRADLAVYVGGTWRIVGSTAGSMTIALGSSTDLPVPGDYDGDGRADAAVFRPGTGEWFVRDSSTGVVRTLPWGEAGDMPVPGDYDGDRRTDVAVWRSATGEWRVLGSKAGPLPVTVWGAPGDVPVPRDYDGDRRTDKSVYRP